MKTARRAARRAATLLLVLAVTSACSHPAAPRSIPVAVHLKNFHIAMATQLRAGVTRLRIASAGPTMHELVVAATDLPADSLPLAGDGTVNGESLQILAEAEGIDIGDH